VRGTSAEAEQRPAQSERLSQLSESLPEWRIRRSGGGAERFVAPFVTLRRSRTMRLSAGGTASRTHGSSAFKKQSARISESDVISRQCVGGDGHPVGVRRHLNDPRI